MNRIISIIMAFYTLSMFAQEPQIINVVNRETKTLNGRWHYLVDQYEVGFLDYRLKPYDLSDNPPNRAIFLDIKPANKSQRIEYGFDNAGTLVVPREWNTQDDKLFLYEGTVWYRRIFNYHKEKPTNRVFIHFGAVNYESHVYLNQKKLGKHIGGFTPFNFEITDLLKDEANKLVVKVDNKRKREGVPTVNTDWFNYGGITRHVRIVEVPTVFIQDYMIQLEKGSANIISGYVKINGAGAGKQVTVSIPGLNANHQAETGKDGVARVKFSVKGLTYWSPETPKLYDVTLSSGEDEVTDQIGFRTLETKGTDILLNGNPVFLRGISLHEENPIRGGRAYSVEDARMLFTWAKELNCNFVRLAHYPHNENMARVADEMGILLWEENPVYWTILWDNLSTLENAKNQLTELITRDKNRASVIIWSMANETPVSEARTAFLKELTDLARSLDDTRFISAAMEKTPDKEDPLTQIVEDPFAEYVDIVSFNEYVGWYDGLPEKCTKVKWEIPYNKPVIISEFGGGALQGFHADKLTIWSEEFQEDIYVQTVKMLKKIDKLRGVTPWILCDFRSPRRLLPNIQDGWNRKGLISETGNKKKAFYVLKKYYQQQEKEYKK